MRSKNSTSAPDPAAPEDVELLAELGLPALPLRPGGKAPESSPFFAPRGSHDASADIRRIRHWSALSPKLNWGAALPGLLVADFDVRNGGDRDAFEFPLTWESWTGGGGDHVFFRLPPGANITGGQNKIAQGVDAKTGRNSYVLIPPSRTEAFYRWKPGRSPFDIPLATAPDWLIRKLTPPPAPQPQQFQPRTDDETRVRDALHRVPAHDRDVWLRVGMALKAHFGEGGRALWDEWAATCPEKFDPRSQAKAWRSFRREGVGLGTIFHLSSRRRAYA
jgi:hypothetical protein